MTAYYIARRRPSGPAHLSADGGRYTLRHWRIRGSWWLTDAAVALSVPSIHVPLCRQCRRAAERRELEQRRTLTNAY